MTLFKCKMCGGNLKILNGHNVTEYECCGTRHTVPILDNEKTESIGLVKL